MRNLLDYKVKINRNPKYKNLYSWSLNEFDNNDKQVGNDWVPFIWDLWFTATSIQFLNTLNINQDNKTKKSNAKTTKTIQAKCYSGICVDGENLTDSIFFSIFGTERKVKEFYLDIKESEDKEENCRFTVIPSYETEDDISEDYVGISVRLNSERFNELVNLVTSRSIDYIKMRVGKVDGAFSHWSPSIETSFIKFLTKYNTVEGTDKNQLKDMTVNKIKEFNLEFITNTELTITNKMPSVDFTGKFDNYSDSNQEENNSSLPQIKNNQSEINTQSLTKSIKSIKLTLWSIFAVLIIFLFLFF